MPTGVYSFPSRRSEWRRTFEPRRRLENLEPLPPTISPGDHVDLWPLVFEVNASLPEEAKKLLLRYRVFGPNLNLPEQAYSFDELLSACL